MSVIGRSVLPAPEPLAPSGGTHSCAEGASSFPQHEPLQPGKDCASSSRSATDSCWPGVVDAGRRGLRLIAKQGRFVESPGWLPWPCTYAKRKKTGRGPFRPFDLSKPTPIPVAMTNVKTDLSPCSRAPGGQTVGSEAVASMAGPPATLTALLLAVGLALLWAGSRPASAQPQDTIQVAGIALAPGDSAKAQRLLRTDLGPTSRRWARLHDSAGRGRVAKSFLQMARLAYPSDTRADSMLAFFRTAGTGHPDSKVRAEFLFGGLQVASSADRGEAQEQFYERLTDGHEGSRYAKQAERLFAPDSQIEAGNELPEFELPRLSDSTATLAKSDFEGKAFLIDFWGTWCGPCVQAMPHLHEAYRKHGGEDFTILSVAMRDTREAIERFRSKKWEMPWNHAFVPKGSDLQTKVRGRFDITGLPAAILVGPGGKILSVTRGVGSGEEVAEAIREALADGKGAPASESISGEMSRP